MNLGHQIAGKEVKGTIDILKISAIYLRYFRYFTDISPIFVRYTFDISTKYQQFPIFCRNIDDFPNIMSIFRPTDYRFDTNRYPIYRPILTIFCSLVIIGSDDDGI